MLIVVDSLTGQGMRFAEKTEFPYCELKDYDRSAQPLFLVTRSFNFGEVPDSTLDFLDRYAERVVGVAVTGNRNWGTNFGAAGDKIQAEYGIPLVCKFEGSGFNKDVALVRQWLTEYEQKEARI